MKKLLTLMLLSMMSLTSFSQGSPPDNHPYNMEMSSFYYVKIDTTYTVYSKTINPYNPISYSWDINEALDTTSTNPPAHIGSFTTPTPSFVVPHNTYKNGVDINFNGVYFVVIDSSKLNSTGNYTSCTAYYQMIMDTLNYTTLNHNYYIYNCSSGANLSYTWKDGLGQTFTGSNFNYSYVAPPGLSYTLTLYIQSTTGCTDSFKYSYAIYRQASSGDSVKFNFHVLTPNATDVETISQTRNQLTVYPNPVKTELKILTTEDIKSVVAIDLNGRITTLTNKKIVNLEKLTPGLYFIEIKTDKGTYTEKIIKE